ncbi:terminase [Bifidobacterium phasiani]|nr:terminase [Bifidobacterium phasiani]
MRRLSELARHLVRPSGITGSEFPRVQKIAARAGIGYDPWQQGLLTLMLAKRADGLYACGEGGATVSICRQVGKTYTVGTSTLILCLLHPGMKVLWTAHRARTSNETFKSLTGLARRKTLNRYVAHIRSANGQQEIELRNGSRIMFGAREQGFGRGFDDVDMEIFDEAQILTVKALDDMIPATNTARNPLIVFTGTPPKPGDPCEVFAEKRRQALAGKDGMLYVELSADRDADPDDREQWAKANPSYPARTSEQAILRMRSLLGEDSFRREGLGIWDETSTPDVIDPRLWAASATETPDLDGLVGYALDMNPERTSLAIGGAILHQDGSVHIELKRFEDTTHKGLRWAVDWIAERWPRTAAVVIDKQSPAMGLLDDLKHAHVRPILTEANDMGRACGRFIDLLHDHRLTHLDDDKQPALALAVKNATIRRIGTQGAFGWNKLTADADISPLVAVTLAAYGTAITKRNPNRRQKVNSL